MADEANKVVILFVLLSLAKYSSPTNLIPKCSLTVGGKTYKVTSRTWKYKTGGYTYSINLCESLNLKAPCIKSRICKDSGSSFYDLGGKDSSKVTTSLAVDGSGFSLEYGDGTCEKTSGGKLRTLIQMKCGNTMGSPKLIDEFTNQKECVLVFEFITNEACKKPPSAAEVPCSFYNGTSNKKIDLSPLIKVTGGYEVVSTNFSDDFFINVCRDITPEKKSGSTFGCPKGSSSCRKPTSGSQAAVTIGNVTSESVPRMVLSTGHVEIIYNTTSTVPGCKENPSTKITFVCPKDLHQASGKGPVMTSVDNCMYEVFWETEYACPQELLLSNNSCMLSNEFFQFDLTPLQRAPGHNYKVNGTDIKSSKKYFYYINVCRSTNIPDCSPSGYNASVCQEIPDANTVTSLGLYYKQTLTYTDGQLTLKYKGGKVCSDGFPRETIINFKCNPLVDQGNPVFNGELSHCVYFFDWETRYACPPTRRTGSSCRVTSDKGIRFDLSELVRLDQSNWLAIDGETSSSDRKIYLNVCGKLAQQTETSKCDVEAAVCLVNKDGSVKSLGRYLKPPMLNPDKSVKLVYTNGDECIKGVLRKTTITFVCHPGDLTSPPVLVSHSPDDCEYTLMWETGAACSLGVNVGDNCKVEDKDAGYVFDLGRIPTSPYFDGKFASVKHGKYNFYLQVCKAVNDTSKKPCFSSTTTGGCQVDSSLKPPKIVSIGVPNLKLYYYDGIIKLTYSDGDKCHNNKPRETHIWFICDPKASHNGDGLPEYDREEHCVYHFRWPTKYACPSKVVECAVRSGSGQYDLSTLSKTDDNWQTRVSSIGKFYINVCRSLNLKPAVSKCRGTSAVCLVDNSGNFIDLGGVDKSLNVTSPGTITITYTKGLSCASDRKLNYETQIMFVCKKGATDTSPVFQTKDKCTYKFRWETASACAITNVVGSNCSVQDPKSDTVFNLFPLNRNADNPYIVKTLAGRTFQLNICGNILNVCGRGKDSQVAVCMNETNSNMFSLGVTSQQLSFMGETLVLTYRNGDRDTSNGFPRITKIRFYCNPEEPLGQPKYIEQASEKDGEVFYFDFQTSLACSAKQIQCAVGGPQNKKYDLTPLGLVNGNWEAVDTRAAYSHLHYYINICKTINPSASSDIKCPGGAIGACQVDHKTSKGHNLGYIQSNPTVTSDGEVTIRYYGGDACHGKYNRSTRINLSCSKTMGSPVFRGETPECEYIFHWETPSACALTSEYGTNCKVIDRQYNYEFDFSPLSGKDYSVSGLPGGGTVMFDVCEQISGTSCKGSNVAACLSTPVTKEGKILGTISNNITYLEGEVFILYRTSSCSIKITFECDQKGSNKQPVYESFKAPCQYSIRFPTILACRPFSHVQCSLRRESSDKKSDLQYDFTPLAKRNGNWKAVTTSSSAASPSYWINVCQPIHQTGDALHCPPTAGVCKYDPAKKSFVSLGTLRSGPVVENDNIYLWYKGGDPCDKLNKIQSSAKILMQCGSSTESSPQLINEYTKTCLYEFVWVTKYACPINTASVNITNDCTAVHPQTKYKFDLNSLSSNDKTVKDERGYYYLLNVCKALNDNKATPCGSSSGSCQLSLKSKNLHHNAGNYNKRLSYNDGVLSLNYSGGDVCFHSKTKRQTLISFVCDPKVTNDSLSKPVFVAETDDCSYYFTWHTRLACERKVECSPVEYKGKTNIKYSLHDLANDQQNWVVMPLDGQYKGTTFYINICRSLVPVIGVNCPAGASACMRSKDGKTVQSLGRAVSRPKVKDRKIVINYQNGTNQAQTTIELTCNPGSLGNPVFVSKDGNNYVFSWATLAACAQTETPQTDKCRVYDNNTEYFYDVSPLKKAKNNFISLTAPDGSTVYASVCGAVPITGCDGDGVCKTQNNKATSLGKFKFISMAYLNDEQMLLLKYCSSQTCTQQGGAVVSTIMFVCDENAVSHEQYSLDSVRDSGANIIWKTNLVCPPARQQCILSDSGLLFDLELLSSKTRSWHYTSSKGYKFWLNICRGVEDQTGCPPYATVCAQFGGNDPQIVALGYGRTQKITRSREGKQLLVRYTGQSKVPACTRKGISAEVTFQFTCGSQVGKPKLIYSSFTACSFTFSWATKAACQTKLDVLKVSDCQIRHPATGRLIDFKKIDKSPIMVQGDKQRYFFSLCGKLGTGAPSACSGKSICRGDQGYEIKSKDLHYEDFTFEWWFITKTECPGNKKTYETFIINFQCSDKDESPVFEYASSKCHYVFSWSTPIVCTTDKSGNIDDTATGAQTGSSAGKKAGIAVAVIFTLLGVALIIFILHNHRRRASLVVFVRSNVRRIRRKGDSSSNAVYKYQKITVENGEDNDLLLGFSDDEDEHEDEHEHDHEEDDDMLTL